MRVLHVIDSGGLYGAEVMLLHLMVEQLRAGLQPLLASIGLPGEGPKALETTARERGIEVVPVRMAAGPNLGGGLRLLRLTRERSVDLLHAHGYKPNILLGLLLRPLRRLPMVTTLHGYTSQGAMGRMRLYELLDRLSLRFIDRVVLVNPQMRELPALRRLHNLHVIANGMTLDAPESPLDPELLGFLRRCPTLAAVGRLSPEKGFGDLLQALAQLRAEGHALQLLLLGEGPLRPMLEAQIEQLGLQSCVRLPGYVPAVAGYLTHCALLAMPSHTEGLPMVLLEAAAAGVPVVATAVGGIPQVLEEGRGGWLVPPGSPAALVQAVAEALAVPEESQRRAQRAQALVRSRYSSRTMAECYQQLYEGLLAG